MKAGIRTKAEDSTTVGKSARAPVSRADFAVAEAVGFTEVEEGTANASMGEMSLCSGAQHVATIRFPIRKPSNLLATGRYD